MLSAKSHGLSMMNQQRGSLGKDRKHMPPRYEPSTSYLPDRWSEVWELGGARGSSGELGAPHRCNVVRTNKLSGALSTAAAAATETS